MLFLKFFLIFIIILLNFTHIEARDLVVDKDLIFDKVSSDTDLVVDYQNNFGDEIILGNKYNHDSTNFKNISFNFKPDEIQVNNKSKNEQKLDVKENSNKNEIDVKDLVFKENDLPLNMYNLIYLALERNNNTKQAFLNIKIAESKLAEQKSVYYPNLSASSNYSENYGDSYSERSKVLNSSLDLSYNIFSFGKNSATVKAMNQYLSSTKYKYDKQVQDIIYDVISNYYNLLLLEAKKGAAIENELLSQETYKAASLKYNIGLVPLVDSLKSKSSYSQSKLERIRIENEIKKQKAAINNILNLDPDYILYFENPEIDIKGIENKVDYYINEAKKNRPDLKDLLAQKEQAVFNLKATRAGRYPTINLKGSISDVKDMANKNSDNYVNNNVTVSVSVPLFSGFSVSNDIKSQKKTIELINLSIEQKEKDISNEVWNAYQDFITNQASYFISKDLLETANENAKVSLGMYKNGKASILDVLDSQNQLESAKFDFINSKYNWLIYRMQLLKVIGKMDLENIINIDNL